MKKIIFLLLITFTCQAQTWVPVGAGTNGSISSLVVYNNTLVAGGGFSVAGGNTVYGVAQWNGASWSNVGGVTNEGGGVYALQVYNANLYAGGLHDIMQWDGTTWTSVANCDIVLALATYNGKLYGGSLNYTPCSGSHIIIYDGAAFSTVPVSGSYPSISALGVYNGELYAGGNFTAINGVSANNIAKFNGTSWSAVTGMNGAGAMCVYNGEFYVSEGSSIYKFNGTTWTVVGTFVNGGIGALAVYNNMLWAGGVFITVAGTAVNNIATWDGTNWAAAGSIGTDSTGVNALCVYNGELYAAGNFSTVGGNPANYIAKIDSTTMGIKQLANTIQLTVYPNPATSSLQVSINKGYIVKFTLYDVLGKEAISTKEKNMDVSGLPGGVYFVQVKTGEGVLTKKIIVQH